MFNLTDFTIQKILFAMENQTDEFVLVENSDDDVSLLPFSESFDLETRNPESVYSLPKWFSEDGFELLENFVNTISDSSIKSELEIVLSNGRGVFKNFKNVLKNHPEYENRFRVFKEQKMKSKIFKWYDSLRESWGLEKLNLAEELLFEDFDFKNFDFFKDNEFIKSEHGKVSSEFRKKYPSDVGNLLADIWDKQTFNKSFGFVCRTSSNEFAGCILVNFSESESTVARESVTLTTCFVNENCRGLGIAKKLFSLCLSDLKERGVHNFLIASPFIPNDERNNFEKMLFDLGFNKVRLVYVARI